MIRMRSIDICRHTSDLPDYSIAITLLCNGYLFDVAPIVLVSPENRFFPAVSSCKMEASWLVVASDCAED